MADEVMEDVQPTTSQAPLPAIPMTPVPSLRECCIITLIRFRQHLGDVGDIDPQSVRDILSHCNKEELAYIEDSTREGSNRGLAWYTWHFWYRHYSETFSRPPPDIQVVALPDDCPEDYIPPNVPYPPGDWRAMLDNKQKEMDARAKALSGRLRQTYAAEKKIKDSKKVEMCVIKPPARRSRITSQPTCRFGKPSAPAAGLAGAASRDKVKMMKSIGLLGNRPNGSTNIRDGIKVRTTTTVHPAAAPKPSEQRFRVLPPPGHQKQQQAKSTAPSQTERPLVRPPQYMTLGKGPVLPAGRPTGRPSGGSGSPAPMAGPSQGGSTGSRHASPAKAGAASNATGRPMGAAAAAAAAGTRQPGSPSVSGGPGVGPASSKASPSATPSKLSSSTLHRAPGVDFATTGPSSSGSSYTSLPAKPRAVNAANTSNAMAGARASPGGGFVAGNETGRPTGIAAAAPSTAQGKGLGAAVAQRPSNPHSSGMAGKTPATAATVGKRPAVAAAADGKQLSGSKPAAARGFKLQRIDSL